MGGEGENTGRAAEVRGRDGNAGAGGGAAEQHEYSLVDDDVSDTTIDGGGQGSEEGKDYELLPSEPDDEMENGKRIKEVGWKVPFSPSMLESSLLDVSTGARGGILPEAGGGT